MSGFAVIDFETTGFVPERGDRVVEVGIVLLDDSGQREDAWTTLVNPKRDVGASHVHGITAGELIDAPEFSEISDHLLRLVSGRAVVAHNATFDMRFLHHELLRCGYGLDDRPRALCSMKWAGRLLGQAKLEHCCEALGIPLTEAHTALADAEATGQLLAQLMTFGRSLPDWHDDLLATRSFGWPSARKSQTPRTATRRSSEQPPPHSWMADVLADAWIPGGSEDEASYLDALSNALLDFHISATEGRSLVSIAQYSGLSGDRVLALHREHLGRLAAEAWSDGVLTDAELTDLCTAATHMGLDASDVASALDANREARGQTQTALLQAGDRVVFTGTLAKPREQWISEIISAGLTAGGVTKSTRVVVAADPDSLSGKAAKARDYGVPVINERAFEKYFEEYVRIDRPMAL
ncbi:exonuclease domain-containing protein [Leucobacter celer]|uniref:exonuclease domain-containing protein n=1 Tax=Leucobacter celer TaxID=668625 RepID=UPI0006A794EE|nr:exonuclease domain-containing protein [Leucobacter celer]